MAIEILNITWSKLYPFSKALNQPETKEGGVYAMYKLKGSTYTLHYIGKTIDFSKRFSAHKNNASHMMSETELNKCYYCCPN